MGVYLFLQDLAGSEISSGDFNGNASVKVSAYPGGMHFLKVSDGETEVTKKFLVKKQ